MRCALIGYGRMGRAIECAAAGRDHAIVEVVDPATRPGEALEARRLSGSGVQVAFEFTAPSAAAANVATLLEGGIPVVCGTTGWAPDDRLRSLAEERGVSAVVAPNFSVGMNLMYRVVRLAAESFGATGLYAPYVWEMHHAGKADAPGGTAMRLAHWVHVGDPRHPQVVSDLAGKALPEGAVHVAAVRAGHEPGRHVVGFDGPFDAVEMEHRARGREGFALGAVLAAEWLATAPAGVHGFDAVLDSWIERARGGAL